MGKAIKSKRKEIVEKHIPLVIFKRNRSKTYAVLEFKELLKLLDE